MDLFGWVLFGAVSLVALAAWPRKSKRVPDNVIQFVPRSSPPRASVEAAGQVIEFPIVKGETKR